MKDKLNSNLSYPAETPWGTPQDVCIIVDGIVRISTAGHGGYWLSPERNKQVPYQDRLKTFCQNGLNGWYEEDEDYVVVEHVFADLFDSLAGRRSVETPERLADGSVVHVTRFSTTNKE